MLRPIVLAVLFLLAPQGFAQNRDIAPDWVVEKCARYKSAWIEAQKRLGTKGLGAEFLTRHNAFIETGCTARANVCPRSAQELDMANTMTLRALNAGMSGTFLPFACRQE
ncbi:MAG: hypothetical protein ACRDBL_13860 [Rhabdaerophilum sp.]